MGVLPRRRRQVEFLEAYGSSPSGRVNHTAIYDPVRRRMIVFGGSLFPEPLGDLWEPSLDGVPTWRPMLADGSGPDASPRTYRDLRSGWRPDDRLRWKCLIDLRIVPAPVERCVGPLLVHVYVEPAESERYTPDRAHAGSVIYDPVRRRMILLVARMTGGSTSS